MARVTPGPGRRTSATPIRRWVLDRARSPGPGRITPVPRTLLLSTGRRAGGGGTNALVLRSAIVAAPGGLLFGFDTAEIAPPRLRGRLVGLVQFNIVLGILLAYLSNFVLGSTLPEDVAWRWMFLVMAFPAAVFFLLVFPVPETPRWLFSAGRRDEAVEVVRRTTQSREEAEFEIREIEQSLAEQQGQARAAFFVRRNRKVIMLAVAVAAFNQLSGINAVLYYAPDIFRLAGAGESAALQSVIIGLVNLVTTMAALTVIDKIGRRRLMLVGSIGYLVSLGSLAVIFFVYDGQFPGFSSILVLAGLVVFIAAHAFGQGAVIWVFISEIFPNRIRGRGSRWAASRTGCSRPSCPTPSPASPRPSAAGWPARCSSCAWSASWCGCCG